MKLLLKLWKEQWFRYATCFIVGAAATTLIYPSVSKQKEEVEKIKNQYEQQLQELSSKSKEELELLESSHQAELNSVKSDSAKKQEELSRRINSLVQENSTLKRQTRTTTVEKIFPDGTIERRIVSEETMETVTQKVAEVKEQLEKQLKEETSKLERQHQKQIDETKTSYEVRLAEFSTKLQRTEQLLVEERSKKESIEKNQRKLGVSGGYNSDNLYKVHGHYTFWGPLFVGADVDTNGKDKNRAAISLGINF